MHFSSLANTVIAAEKMFGPISPICKSTISGLLGMDLITFSTLFLLSDQDPDGPIRRFLIALAIQWTTS